VAAIVAIGVNADGRREVLGMDIGLSEAETFWAEFLAQVEAAPPARLEARLSDPHEGIKAAVASW
jgi:transposase-like protein